jgi:signal transduction histidine kinase
VAKREIAERIDGELTVEASPPCPKAADVRRDVDAAYDRCAVRSLVLSISDLPARNAPPARAPAAVPLADERRPVERDLHEGVQNELVALVVKLALAREDAGIPPPVAKTLAGSKVRARAALDMVREIVRGTYPPQLADFDLARALRARAARGPVDTSLEGPRLGTVTTISLPWSSGSEAYQR